MLGTHLWWIANDNVKSTVSFNIWHSSDIKGKSVATEQLKIAILNILFVCFRKQGKQYFGSADTRLTDVDSIKMMIYGYKGHFGVFMYVNSQGV